MKKRIDWLFFGFFITGYLFGSLKQIIEIPLWLFAIIGVALGVFTSLLKKKLSKE